MQEEWRVSPKKYRDILEMETLDVRLIYQMIHDINARLERIEESHKVIGHDI